MEGFPLVFGWSMVGIAKKVSVGKLLFPPVLWLGGKGFSWGFFACDFGGTGLGVSEAAPCPGNTGGNEKTQGTHCLVIPQVLMSLGIPLPFPPSFRYFLCLFVRLHPGFFSFKREYLREMKLTPFWWSWKSSIDFYSNSVWIVKIFTSRYSVT